MSSHSRICAQIHLDAFSHNLDEIERLIAPETQICAVVKTDAYGHGAVPLARLMEERKRVWGYAVATAEEALELSDAGLSKPILVLGYVFPEDLETLLSRDIRLTVFSPESARECAAAAQRLGKTAHVHVKIDTGMGRIGFPCGAEAADALEQIAKLPNLSTEGIFTHFAKADEADKTFSHGQEELFFTLLDQMTARGIAVPMRHIANSAGILDLPESDLDLVRAGIILYGLYPSGEVRRERINLQPLMSLTSHVVQVKTMTDGQTVSYGGTYVVHGTETIATVPVGYGDGYPRSLSNKGHVLIHGRRAPIVGRICMDQFMVNVTGIGDVRPGDEVTLIGRDGAAELTMEELADCSGRFVYEFACDIGKRVPRVYV